MAILNTKPYIELISDIVATSESVLNGFDGAHSIIYGYFYLLAYSAMFIGTILKIGRDNLGMQDKIQLGNFAVMGGLLAVFLFPVSYSSEGTGYKDVKVALGYKASKQLFINLLKFSHSATKNTVQHVYEQNSRNSYSPSLAMYQTERMDSIMDTIAEPEIMVAYNDYRKICSVNIGQNQNLNVFEKEAFGYGPEPIFGRSDTLEIGYNSFRFNNKKFADMSFTDYFSSNNPSMKEFDEVISQISNKQFIPDKISPREYPLLNGGYLKAKIVNQQSERKLESREGGKYVRQESGDSQFYIYDKADGDQLDSSVFTRSYKRGMEEYTAYLNEKLSEYPDSSFMQKLLEPGMPLNDSNTGQPLKLVPIDCVSFAMITNIIVNQVSSSIGSSTLFSSNTHGQMDLNKENGFITRMLAVNLAMHTLSSHYKVADLEAKEQEKWYDPYVSYFKNIVDMGVKLMTGYEEVKEKVMESYQQDIAVPIIFMGFLLAAGAVLSLMPIILTVAFVLPDGVGVAITLIKIFIFILLSIVLSSVALQFIDVQVTQSVNEWLKANYNTSSPPFLGDYDLSSVSTNVAVNSSSLGTAALSAKMLAANESTGYAYYFSIFIAYGLVFDFKMLLRPGMLKSSMGSRSGNIAGNAATNIPKNVPR